MVLSVVKWCVNRTGRSAVGYVAHYFASTLPPFLSREPPPTMVFAVFSSHAAYNDSITVRTPAPPRPHLAFSRGCLPRAPETCTTFTRGCMTSVARPTQIERPPGACLKFWRGSGLPGRTLWGVFMDHLEFGEQTVPLRAASEIFLATVAQLLGR